VREGELEVLGKQLLDVRAADVGGLLDLDNLEDVDRPESGTVAGSHVLVEGVDSLGTRHLTVFLVHVVGTGARVVTDPDTKVLDLGGPLLMDLIKRYNLSSALLDLSELLQEVPEAGLCNNSVWCKQTHPVELGSSISLGRKLPADDLVLMEATHC